MKKRKIVITGAGSGLGKDAAVKLAKRGHIVYATTHFENECDFFYELANKENLNLYSFKLDILNYKDLKKLDKIDFDTFISNAAISDTGSILEIDIDRIKNVFETNVFANIRISQIVLNKFIDKQSGKIIFLSSLAGFATAPFYSPYCSSKFTIECFTKSLKQELKLLKDLGINIQIKVIVPGAYKTGFNEKMAKRKYDCMKNQSYFKSKLDFIRKIEKKIWNFIELKNFNSIIKKYIQAVESENNKFKYFAPFYQVFIVKFYKIFEIIFSM